MDKTIFNTPILKNMFAALSGFLLKILGWKKVGRLPDCAKYIIIVAPHTSNWDLFYGILLAFTFRLDPRFIAKKQLFRQPFAPLMKWLGGLAVDRSSANNTVDQMVGMFHDSKNFVLALAPEGTRHKTAGWKSGFYQIALKARVPIQIAFLDYDSKSGGAGPFIHPTGHLEQDLQTIQHFYRTVSGKYPDKVSPVVIGYKT
ncbi:MAG: 1-acyl-sn-glycerol-3-phosphate acyltransferase [Deltaproteobacteria bacterium]